MAAGILWVSTAAGAFTPARTATLAGAVAVEVDATEAPRGIERVHLIMPVKPGALTLLYPKWLPGEHSPTGPISGLSGLTFTANGRPLEWRRDLDNMYAFHLQIPSGVSSLDAKFEVLSVQNAANHNALRVSTDSLAIILWNELERLDRIQAGAPLDGLAASGWRLTYAAEPSPIQKGEAALWKGTDLWSSLGFYLLDEGAVVNYLIPGSPADQAGMAPGSKLVAVDGRRYTKEVLQDALKAGGTDARTLSLLVERDDLFKTVELRYAGHARYPRLERDSAHPDLLTAIDSPLTH